MSDPQNPSQSSTPLVPERQSYDWEVALQTAQSELAAADAYGGSRDLTCYVPPVPDPYTGLIEIRQSLQRYWMLIEYKDIPLAVACIDRVIAQVPAP